MTATLISGGEGRAKVGLLKHYLAHDIIRQTQSVLPNIRNSVWGSVRHRFHWTMAVPEALPF